MLVISVLPVISYYYNRDWPGTIWVKLLLTSVETIEAIITLLRLENQQSEQIEYEVDQTSWKLNWSKIFYKEWMSYKCSRLWNFITTSLSNLLLHILQKEKIATNIAAKIAHLNGPLGTNNKFSNSIGLLTCISFMSTLEW